ncbi:MAG TPA: hypothetical protein VFS43_19680 [Polyangiaceae bacterium]|nr:hypothetical protein [Polyangiaceae bacterium]
MIRYRHLLVGAGLAALTFGAGCGGEGVSLGNDGNAVGADGKGAGPGPGIGPDGRRAPIAADDLVRLLQADFEAQGRPAGVRYVSLHTFYNDPSFSDDRVRDAADAVSELANHLATRQERVERPSPVSVGDAPPFALRFALGAYDLGEADWQLIEQGGNVPPRAQPCGVPVLTAEQFLGSAGTDEAYEPLAGIFQSVYSNIVLRRLLVDAGRLAPDQLLFAPVSEDGFIAQGFANIASAGLRADDIAAALGVDVRAETQAAAAGVEPRPDVARACVPASAERVGPRCEQRHGRPDGGSLWWTFDTLSKPAAAAADPFVNPIGPANPDADPIVVGDGEDTFRSDGGHLRFTLRNGLAAVVAFNANLDPISTFGDYVIAAGGGTISPRSGIRSLLALGTPYVAPAPDQLRDYVTQNGDQFSDAEASFALRLTVPRDAFDAAVASDQAGYAAAVSGTFEGAPPADAAELFTIYEQDLPEPRVLATLAMTLDELAAILRDHPELSQYAPPLGGAMSREAFSIFETKLRDALAPPAASLLNACVVP